MTNRRQSPRFRLSNPPAVAIEYGQRVSGGRLVDVSKDGAQLVFPGRVSPGQSLLMEVLGYETVLPVEVVRAEHNNVGVRFLPTGEHERLVSLLLEREPHAAMEVRGEVVYFKGVLSFSTRRDFLYAAAKYSVIDLSQVHTVDTAGLALCLIALERHGVKLRGCQDAWRSLMCVGKVCVQCAVTHGCTKAGLAA